MTGLEDIIDMVPNTEPSLPFVSYDPDGDCVEFIAARDGYYAERVDSLVTVYRSRETDEVVGSLIKGVKKYLQDLAARAPGFLLEIEDGKIKLQHVFTARLWQDDVMKGKKPVVITYKRLREVAEESDRYMTDDPGAAHLIPHLNESGGPTVEYRRGFVHAVKCPLATWMRIGPTVVRSHPVTRVDVTDREPTQYRLSQAGDREAELRAAQARFWPDIAGLDAVWIFGDDTHFTDRGWDSPRFSHMLPGELFDDGFRRPWATSEDARTALSARLIAWAKSQPVTQPDISGCVGTD